MFDLPHPLLEVDEARLAAAAGVVMDSPHLGAERTIRETDLELTQIWLDQPGKESRTLDHSPNLVGNQLNSAPIFPVPAPSNSPNSLEGQFV